MAKSKVGARKRSNFIVRYLRESIAELRKVNWPSRQEARKLTIIVLVVIVFMSSLLAVLDRLFSLLFSFIISLGG